MKKTSLVAYPMLDNTQFKSAETPATLNIMLLKSSITVQSTQASSPSFDDDHSYQGWHATVDENPSQLKVIGTVASHNGQAYTLDVSTAILNHRNLIMGLVPRNGWLFIVRRRRHHACPVTVKDVVGCSANCSGTLIFVQY